MHGFPSEFPQQGLSATMKPLFQSGSFDGQAALGAYDILGFALYQVYGDVKYLMQDNMSRSDMANLMAQAPPEVQSFMQFANQNPNLMQGELPPWLKPFAMQLIEWALSKLFERLSQQENPTLFGLKIKNTALPRETGGAFPERKLGVPTSAGLFTTPTPGSKTQTLSQPSDKIQQPTGVNPDWHPTNPQSSKSPQFQGNTADPEKEHEAHETIRKPAFPGSPSSQPGGPPGPVTNAPGVSGTPGTTTPPNPNQAKS